MRDTKILAAEAIGTFILMMGGPGVAVLAAGTGALDGAAVLAVALGFGFALMIAAYAVGPVSGCHINPAVTLGMALMNKMDRAKVPFYIAGQGLGALAEIILSALLVLVVLSTTRKGFPPAAIGLTVGITLTLIHLISIPVDNTSVNPARSFGMAIFAGSDAIEQLWAFFVFPLIGAIVGAGAYLLVADEGDALA